MATVYEMLDTNVGGSRGQDGIHGFVRRFHVTTDSVDDDPSLVLQTESDGDGTGPINLAQSHPWVRGIVVTNFREAARLPAKGKLDWVVEVLYGPPLVIDPTRPWDIAIDVGLETYTAYVDRDNQPIGPGVYHPVPTEQQYPGPAFQAEKDRLQDVGFDTNGPTFWAPTSDGWTELYPMANGKRRAVGLPCTRKVAQMAASRVIPNLTVSQMTGIMALVNAVNSANFFGARPGTAKFVGMRSRSRSGELIGQISPGIMFECELLFSINWDGHDPSNEYDLYGHKDGTQGIVEHADGTPVKRNYRLYNTAEFNSVLTALDNGSLPGGGDGKAKITRPNTGPTGRLSGGP